MIKGKYLIFSAPSGSGKSTVVNHLMEKYGQLAFSVSATTRQPRGSEKDGVEYHFLSVDEFKKTIAENGFVEWEEVYENQFYGTLRREIDKMHANNKIPVFDIDVKGGARLKSLFGDEALFVFIAPPSLEVLKQRLIGRGTDSPEQIEKRLGKAEFELTYRDKADVCIVNDVLEETFAQAESIVSGFINK